MANEIMLILYVLVGAIAGMIYGLRRVFVLERKIDDIARKLKIPVKKKRK